MKLSNDFYQACVAMRNQPGPQRFISALEEAQADITSELIQSDESDDFIRLQGQARLLKLILDGFYEADEMKRRIDRQDDSGSKGPSLSTIT